MNKNLTFKDIQYLMSGTGKEIEIKDIEVEYIIGYISANLEDETFWARTIDSEDCYDCFDSLEEAIYDLKWLYEQ